MSQALTVFTGTPVLRVDRPRTNYSAGAGSFALVVGGSSRDTRDRTGKAAFAATMSMTGLPTGYAEGTRILSNQELWAAYKVCPDIRSCVEGIVRKIATWDWSVVPLLDTSDPQYELALDVAAQAQHFLEAPNKDGETWQIVWSKAVRDLMVFDAMAIEHCFDAKGRLVELVVLKGGDVTPQEDQYQRLLGYTQIGPNGIVQLEPEQVLYCNLFPNSTAPGGLPLIETLVTETITLLRQARHLMLDFDADEVAPGILALAGIAGDAANRFRQDMENKKGLDNKLRVIHSTAPPTGGHLAEWVEMRHTPKDLDLKEVVKEVRRTCWRVFGVKPVSQGDTEATPRATAEVQVDTQDSDLIIPILELLQGLMNFRTLPLVVGDPDQAAMVGFTFDWGKNLTADEEKAIGERDASDFDRGIVTVNEVRESRGRAPVDGGDVNLVKSSGGYVPLTDVVGGTDTTETGGGGVSEPEAGQPTETAPGEAETGKAKPLPKRAAGLLAGASPAMRGMMQRRVAQIKRRAVPEAMLPSVSGCTCEPRVSYAYRGASLPSDWQAEGKFKGKRTINLTRLGNQLLRYTREVTPLYRRARMDTVSAVRSYLGDGKIDNQELIPLAGRIKEVLEVLHVNWRASTEDIYRNSAQIARDAATHFQGAPVVDDWEAKADRYCDRAMGYLVESGGLIRDIGDQIMSLLVASVRCKPGIDPAMQRWARAILTEAIKSRAIPEDDVLAVLDGVDTALLLGAVRQVYDSNQFRIANWQGRLVELANQVVSDGMEGHAQHTDEQGITTEPQEWWAEWVSVGDESRCGTCRIEGTEGFRKLSQITRRPGGDTQCRGRCRCVLVFWLASEVASGKAERLSNLVT